MLREDFLAAAWEGLLDGMKAIAGAERKTANTAENDTFLEIIVDWLVTSKGYWSSYYK